MASWKDISKHQYIADIAESARTFRQQQEAERRRQPADVFISYSSPDRLAARQMAERLAAAGVTYFLDEKAMKPGDEIQSVLEEEIRKRHFYLLLLSEHSVASHWVVYEWALAKGAGCIVRVLRLQPDITVPAPLSSFVAGDDIDEEVAFYAKQQYDRVSLQVFLRDILRPLSFQTVRNFRRVQDQDAMWEHQDAQTWPQQDRDRELRRQFLDSDHDSPKRIARIEVRLDAAPPQLILHCELERPFELLIAPTGDSITLECWWYSHGDRIVNVHPAFWSAALNELVALLDGTSELLSRNGTEINNMFPVTWA